MTPVTPLATVHLTDPDETAAEAPSVVPKPWWAEMLPTMMKYGSGTIIGLYLVWWLTHTASAQLAAMDTKIDNHVTSTHELVVQLKDSADDENRYRKAMLTLQIMNCKSSQKTEEGKTTCDSVRALIDK